MLIKITHHNDRYIRSYVNCNCAPLVQIIYHFNNHCTYLYRDYSCQYDVNFGYICSVFEHASICEILVSVLCTSDACGTPSVMYNSFIDGVFGQ